MATKASGKKRTTSKKTGARKVARKAARTVRRPAKAARPSARPRARPRYRPQDGAGGGQEDRRQEDKHQENKRPQGAGAQGGCRQARCPQDRGKEAGSPQGAGPQTSSQISGSETSGNGSLQAGRGGSDSYRSGAEAGNASAGKTRRAGSARGPRAVDRYDLSRWRWQRSVSRYAAACDPDGRAFRSVDAAAPRVIAEQPWRRQPAALPSVLGQRRRRRSLADCCEGPALAPAFSPHRFANELVGRYVCSLTDLASPQIRRKATA